MLVYAWEGDLAAIEDLIEQGKNIDVRNEDGRTPLIHALWQGHRDIARYLINVGADVNAVDANGKSVLMFAAGTPASPDIITAILEAGADVNHVESRSGQTALHAAVERFFYEEHAVAVKQLLDGGADINARDTVNGGWTALMTAAYIGCLPIVTVLLKNGAKRSFKDRNGNNALDIAVGEGNHDCVEALSQNPSKAESRTVEQSWKNQRLEDELLSKVTDRDKKLLVFLGERFTGVGVGGYVDEDAGLSTEEIKSRFGYSDGEWLDAILLLSKDLNYVKEFVFRGEPFVAPLPECVSAKNKYAGEIK
ncbi:MAG: ankyrin repeat domain-containing protein [Candidatus Thiodiazotropha sp. (ex Dulcina madagascariensis)]|nr:ankyrin repeat domain-containing protein [Candidatus Thiodiazotropha sp. (ex Dulcina madagascariensis)]